MRELLLQPDGEHRLLDLALEGLVLRQEDQPGELLGDGRAALAGAAGLGVAPHGAGQAPDVHAPVVVEAPVLDRHQGLGQGGRHLRRAELVALEHAARGEDLAVVGFQHERALGRLDLEPAAEGQGGDAVGEVAGDGERPEAPCGREMPETRPRQRGQARPQAGSRARGAAPPGAVRCRTASRASSGRLRTGSPPPRSRPRAAWPLAPRPRRADRATPRRCLPQGRANRPRRSGGMATWSRPLPASRRRAKRDASKRVGEGRGRLPSRASGRCAEDG